MSAGTGDGVSGDAELSRLLYAMPDAIVGLRSLAGLRKPQSEWIATMCDGMERLLDDYHRVLRQALVLATENNAHRTRVAELEGDLVDLQKRYAETKAAFNEAAPDALRALHKRQVDAQSLDATLGAEVAEKVRDALRKKPVVVKDGEQGEAVQVTSPTDGESLSSFFHRCWTACVGTPRYDKGAWKILDRAVDDAEASGKSSAVRGARAAIIDLCIAQIGEPATNSARPSPDRAAWLLHPVSSAGRQTIAASQYEELRREAMALREDERRKAIAPTGRKRCDNCREFGTMVDESGCLVYLWGAGDRKQRATAQWSAQIAETILERQGKAAPTGHAVAGLLAWTKEARKAARADRGPHMKGQVAAYYHAEKMIGEVLGAPSPLDEVVAEVLARADGFADQLYVGTWLELARETADSQDGNHRENAIECAGLAIRCALACDTAPAPTGPRCRHCRAALGAEHTPTCCMRHEPWMKEATETIVSAAACDAKGGA